MSVVPLAAAGPECGGKAHALGILLRAGLPVPDGFVVTGPVDRATLGRHLGDHPVAVRSSGLAEDSVTASFAGQYETVLGARGVDAVLAAIGRCAAGTERARHYREHLGLPERPIPVLVQALVAADSAGVLFTRDPRDGADAIVINAAAGPGAPVVSGAVTPDEIIVTGAGPAEFRELVALGRRCEEILGRPQDVEWAIRGDRVWVLQSRPITRLGASPGRARGPARIVRSADDFARVRPGDVLVCRTTDPAWTPLFRVAAGVVTETGGVLCHAAIVAREFGIPAVVGLGGATSRFADGTVVIVDGAAGTVTEVS
ncbi:PEP/pyruvate-binding domain-containing protein [Dactylosporangium sp. NPDC049140]|uniref:PEP/pyruvate-binding domain-containing protein n=1 Tax=Dactylosporangium sp. NPDC049140 TaxID=3155647 RepID=UPI00340174B0